MRVWIGFLFCVLVTAAEARSKIDYNGAMRRAEAAVKSGQVDPDRDLKPLLEAFAALEDSSASTIVSLKIESLARADGSSPQSVKAYFREHAPAYLMRVLKGPLPARERGRVLSMLQTMQADDAILDEAIAFASADPAMKSRIDSVQSDRRRLRPKTTLVAVDAQSERAALAYLQPRHIGVNADSLRKAAGQGDLDTINALLDAGLDANAQGIAGLSAVGQATSIGCIDKLPGERIVATLKLLKQRGAAIGGADPDGNTYLLGAVKNGCPGAVISALIDLGEPPDVRGSRGLTPLELAIAAANLDAAEVLVARGARMSAKQIDKLFIEPPSDPRVQAILKQAQGAKP